MSATRNATRRPPRGSDSTSPARTPCLLANGSLTITSSRPTRSGSTAARAPAGQEHQAALACAHARVEEGERRRPAAVADLECAKAVHLLHARQARDAIRERRIESAPGSSGAAGLT